MSAEAATPMVVDEVKVASTKVARKPRNYPLNATMKKRAARTKPFSAHKRNLRSSITPGTVLILLTGAYRGCRVVFIKQLASGLLLVSGPFKVNGVPLRRVHQKLVIATTTKLDISAVAVPEHIDDSYFQKEQKPKTKSDDIFATKKQQYVLKDERKADQKTVDSQLIAAIKARSDKTDFVNYIRSMFSLSQGDRPHKMIF